MSVLQHDRLLEDLEVWLNEESLWFEDHKIDASGFYFEKDQERIDVPHKLQDTCTIQKNNLQKNK